MNFPDAFWISPDGESFALPDGTFHADMVISIPERFGITESIIREQEDRSNHEGIVCYLVENGWVRIRKSDQIWIMQVSSDLNTQRHAVTKQIPDWAEKQGTGYEFCTIREFSGKVVFERVIIGEL